MQPGQDDNQGGPSRIPVTGIGSVALDGYELSAAKSSAGTSTNQPGDISWEASEYIHHEKHAGWFMVLAVVALILGAVAVFFKQWTFAALIIVMAVAIVVYARRMPRTLRYGLSHTGVTIETKSYPYGQFKAFGVVQDGAIYSLVLIPIKRFAPELTMYFEEKDGEEIFDLLSSHLPYQEVKLDFVDKLTKKLRF